MSRPFGHQEPTTFNDYLHFLLHLSVTKNQLHLTIISTFFFTMLIADSFPTWLSNGVSGEPIVRACKWNLKQFVALALLTRIILLSFVFHVACHEISSLLRDMQNWLSRLFTPGLTQTTFLRNQCAL